MIRLNKYIANSGICTRKEADVLISKGKIKVNHKVVNSLGFKVNKEDVVEYNGKVLKNEKLDLVFLLKKNLNQYSKNDDIIVRDHLIRDSKKILLTKNNNGIS